MKSIRRSMTEVGAVACCVMAGVAAGQAQTSSRAVGPLLERLAPSHQPAPQQVSWAGGKLFFAQQTSYGRELFVSDGTAAGTRLLKDLAPGARGGLTQSSFVSTTAAPQLWFLAENGTGAAGDSEDAGRELWVSDGTSAGTRLVRDIEPGPAGGAGLAFQWFKGAGYFLVRTAAGVLAVYRSDGTAAGTQVWFDFGTATDVRSAVNIMAGPGRLWFSVRNVTINRVELWTSDGVAAPAKVADFAAGPVLLGVAPDDRVYFSASDGTTGSEWWVATPAAATLLGDLIPGPTGSAPYGFAVLPSGEVLATHGPQGANRPGLWKTDGTPAGTVRLGEVYAVGNTNPTLIRSGNYVFFAGQPATGPDFGLEVWRTDGTAAGTFMVRDVVAGGGSQVRSPVHLTDFNGTLFYTAGDGSYWKTDGTEAGTVRAAPAGLAAATMSSQMSMPAVAGEVIYFPAIDADGPGLFRSDATPAGTRRVFGPVAGPMGWAPKQVLQAVGGRVYFAGPGVDELWRTDGTAAGTFSLGVELANLLVPPTLAGFGGHAYFAGLPEESTRVWLGRTDGTVAGTSWVKDLASRDNGDARLYGAAGGALHFSVSRPETGWEPWVSDGTADGTELAMDIFPGEESAHPGPVFAFGGAAFFAADGGPDGMELWRRSGSPPTVAPFANLAPDGTGPNPSHPREFTPLGDRFLFTARTGSQGRRVLWTSDGTPQGTVPVECAADDPADLVVSGGVVLFAAGDGLHGRELWRSDGTAAGTVLVADVRPGAGAQGSSNPRHLVAAGPRVLFVADDGGHGVEPWVTDGTAAGTRMLKDIYPGLAGSDPALMVAEGQRFAFTALDHTHGREIWVSDGSPEGTVLAEDLHPGPFDAGVVKLVPALGGVFYYAPASAAAAHPGLRFLPMGP